MTSLIDAISRASHYAFDDDANYVVGVCSETGGWIFRHNGDEGEIAKMDFYMEVDSAGLVYDKKLVLDDIGSHILFPACDGVDLPETQAELIDCLKITAQQNGLDGFITDEEYEDFAVSIRDYYEDE